MIDVYCVMIAVLLNTVSTEWNKTERVDYKNIEKLNRFQGSRIRLKNVVAELHFIKDRCEKSINLLHSC